MNENIKVIGYIRVSTEEQAKEGFSLDNQRKDLRDYCLYRGWNLIDVYADEGISGASVNERQGLNMAIRYIEEKDITYLLVWKLSRLSRKVSDVVNLVEVLEKNSTYLISIKDNIDTSSPMGKPFLYIASIFAEMERENMIVQVKGGMTQKAREGKWNGGPIPLGYSLEDKELIVNDDEAEVIKIIFDMYLKGNGYLSIAKFLNSQGFKTRKNKLFGSKTIKVILQNDIYAGRISWGKYIVDKDKSKKGSKVRVFNEDLILTNGTHKEIIEPEIFDYVQELINKNKKFDLSTNKSTYLLSGILKCPYCGSSMSVQQSPGKNKLYKYYRCNKYFNKGSCVANGIGLEKIESEFFDILDMILSNQDLVDSMLRSYKDPSDDINNLVKQSKKLQSEVLKLRDKQSKYIDELFEGDESYRSRIREKISEIDLAVSDLELSILALEKDIIQVSDAKFDVTEIEDLLKSAGKIIRVMDSESQRILINKLIKKVMLEGKHICEIHFSFDEIIRVYYSKEGIQVQDYDKGIFA